MKKLWRNTKIELCKREISTPYFDHLYIYIILYIIHYTLYIIHYTLYIIYYLLYIIYCYHKLKSQLAYHYST